MTVAFTLPGGVHVYAFSLLIGAGASLGIGRLLTAVPEEQRGRAAAAGIALLLVALAGARLVYQLNHPAAPVGLPLGGLSWGGGLLSGWLALPVAAAAAGIPAGRLADALYPVSATVVTAAWLGCWIDGCAYGPLSDAWYAVAARDDWGNIASRFPVQLIGAIATLATLAGADLLQRLTRRAGLTAGFWLTATGLQLWWLQALRADPVPFWLGYPLNYWGAWSTVFLGVLVTSIYLFSWPTSYSER